MRRFPTLRAALLLPLLAALVACAGSGGVREPAAATSVQTPPPPAAPAPAEAIGTLQCDPRIDADATATAQAASAQQGQAAAEVAGADVASAAQDPTQAELDYATIYGAPPYNPVADPTLPPPAVLPIIYDPWEPFNRKVHAFNNGVDRYIAKPLAMAYVAVVPRPVRLGIGNFFANLGQPLTAMNALLQGDPKAAALALARFTVNATIGLGGFFDPASNAGIPFRNEDFGQTLGVWGWERSRYLELPLFGPRTVRDVFGLVGDAPLSPLQQINDTQTVFFMQGLQLVDVRTQLFAVDSMREGATDEYTLYRDAWMQRRNYQIMGDRQHFDDSLPEYLREDTGNPSVPADAMPLIPGSGN